MSINQRQHQQLSEMGISLWQQRHKSCQTPPVSTNNSISNPDYIAQTNDSLTALSKENFFSDVLLALELSIGEVTAQKDHLDLGLFNWFFKPAQKNENTISYSDNKLVSPSIKLISESSALKKQLWQVIMTNLL